jgi:hypothetical protein
MHRLRRQFGSKFVHLLKKSPTLVENLKHIRANNIKIRTGKGYCQAYYNKDTRTIYIGRRCALHYKLISLAHEFVHALIKPTEDPIPGKTGKKEFVNRCLSEEVEAIVHEVYIMQELIAAGMKEKEFSFNLQWLKLYLNGGRKAIRKKLNSTVTSTTGEKYPLYYGHWYDSKVPKNMRLP